MMIHLRNRGTAVAALALTLMMTSASVAGDKPINWAPKTSVLYVGVPSCDELADAFDKSAIGRMMNDPAVKKAAQPWENVLRKFRELVAKKLNLENPQALELRPHGAAAIFLAVAPSAAGQTEPEALLAAVLDMGEELSRAKTLTAAVVSKSLESGARKETEEAAGSEITAIHFAVSDGGEGEGVQSDRSAIINEVIDILKSEDVGINPMVLDALPGMMADIPTPEGFAFAYRDSKVVIGADAISVRTALRMLAGDGERSLGQADAARVIKQHCTPGANIEMVINVPEIVRFVEQQEPDEAKPVTRALGLNSFGPFVLTYNLAPGDGVEGRMRGFLPISDSKKGLGRMLMMANSPTLPLAWVGSEVAYYARANIDLPTIVNEVVEIKTRIDPVDGEQMRAGMKVPQPDGSVLDIQKDILAHLTGPLFGTATVTKPYGPDEFNFMIGLRHKSREGLDKLIAMLPPGFLLPREMMGAMIFESPMLMGAAMGLTDRALIPVGTKNAVEGYVRGEGKSDGGLGEEAAFRKLVRLVPKESCVMVYADSGKTYDAEVAVIQSGTVSDQPQMMFGMSLGAMMRAKFGQNPVIKALDDPSVLRKYQGISISTITAVSDGLQFDAVGIVSK